MLKMAVEFISATTSSRYDPLGADKGNQNEQRSQRNNVLVLIHKL